MTQEELAQKANLTPSHISGMELGRYQSLKDDVRFTLARAFDMSPEAFSTYIYGDKPTDFPEDDRTPHPKQVPIYPEFPSFHLGKSSLPVEYYNYAKAKPSQKNIEGYFVRGNCLAPKIEDGDIIIIDREGAIDNGDIVACLIADELHIAKLRKVADELWLENNNGRYRFQECQVAAPVIEVIRRLK